MKKLVILTGLVSLVSTALYAQELTTNPSKDTTPPVENSTSVLGLTAGNGKGERGISVEVRGQAELLRTPDRPVEPSDKVTVKIRAFPSPSTK